jgi:hypothetical protein
MNCGIMEATQVHYRQQGSELFLIIIFRFQNQKDVTSHVFSVTAVALPNNHLIY